MLILALVACENHKLIQPEGLTYQETEVNFSYIDWGPDSKRLAGSSPDLGHPSPLGFLERQTPSEVFVWDPASDSYIQVSDESPSVFNSNPIWNPNGEQILYYSQDEFGLNGNSGLVDINSLDRLAVSDFGRSMDWFPDGSKFVAENGNKLYSIGVSGERPRELWTAPRDNYVIDLAISADGENIAVITEQSGGISYRTTIISLSDNSEQIVSETNNWMSRIDWSPDGQWLIILEDIVPGKARASAIRADGSCKTEPWQLDFDGDFRDISWAPDGESIAVALFIDRNTHGVLFADTDSEFIQNWLSSGDCGL